MMRQRTRTGIGGWMAAPLAGLLFLSLLLRALVAPGMMPAPAPLILAGVPLVICSATGNAAPDPGEGTDHQSGGEHAICPFATAHFPILAVTPVPVPDPVVRREMVGLAFPISCFCSHAALGAMSARGPPVTDMPILSTQPA